MSTFRRKLQKLFFREQWSLLVCDLAGKPLKRIAPPADRSWADPFPVENDGHYYIFLEQQIHGENGTLGYIELFDDLSYSPFVPILEKDYHLSFPNVFRAEAGGALNWYMIPESNEHRAIDLYRAVDFPARWVFDSTLIEGIQAVDTDVVASEDGWYLFTSCETGSTELNDSLFIFRAAEFPSKRWIAHSGNPVRHDAGGSRMAGRIYRNAEGKLVRPAQSCRKEYGEKIVLYAVAALSEREYSEKAIREILPERKFHAVCTHTWNQCGQYCIRDIKTRTFRFFA